MNRSNSQLSSTKNASSTKLSKKGGLMDKIRRAYNYIWAKFMFAYRKGKNCLWVGSTGSMFCSST